MGRGGPHALGELALRLEQALLVLRSAFTDAIKEPCPVCQPLSHRSVKARTASSGSSSSRRCRCLRTDMRWRVPEGAGQIGARGVKLGRIHETGAVGARRVRTQRVQEGQRAAKLFEIARHVRATEVYFIPTQLRTND